MALESVDYSEEKACKILEIVMQDDKGPKEEIKQEVKEEASVDNETAPPVTSQAESVPNGVNHEERYSFFVAILARNCVLFAKSQTASQMQNALKSLPAT